MLMILRRRPQQAGTADVDHFDRLFKRAIRLGDRLLERVQVHDHHINRLDPLLGELPQVLGIVAVGQNGGVNPRMQRLDAAVHQLRKPGDLFHQRDRQVGVLEHPGGTAGRDQLDAELLVQGPREVDDPGLVINAKQRPADLQRVGHDSSFATIYIQD